MTFGLCKVTCLTYSQSLDILHTHDTHQSPPPGTGRPTSPFRPVPGTADATSLDPPRGWCASIQAPQARGPWVRSAAGFAVKREQGPEESLWLCDTLTRHTLSYAFLCGTQIIS